MVGVNTDGDEPHEQVNTLISGLIEGEVEQLATALDPTVADDLYSLLNPDTDERLFDDPATALERLRMALVAQSGEPESIDVADVEADGVDWDSERVCGEEPAPSRFEITVDCRHGQHQLGVGLDEGAIVELAFVDEYTPPADVDQNGFTEQELAFENDGLEFCGSLTLPAEDDPNACVILVHGSGETDRNYESGAQQFLKDVAWGLADRGIASYRYDKRSYLTDIDESNVGLDWPVVDDALAATRAVAEHPDIDKDQLFLAGHSRGGMFAPRIAEHFDAYRGVIILEGYAQSFPEYMAELYREHSEQDWATDRERAAIDGVITQIDAFLESELNSEEELMGRPMQYIQEVSKYDKTGTAASLESPVLVLQGGADLPEFKEQSANLWQESLTQPDSKVSYSPEFNHFLQRTHSQSVGVEAGFFHDNVSSDAIEEAATWITAIVD